MDPALKEEWLTALRGEAPKESRLKRFFRRITRKVKYPKTKDSLRDENGFCCLGVLADILEPDGWRFGYRHETYNSYGTHHETGEIIGNLQHKDRMNLMGLNDKSDTFEPVIEYIKENL